MIMLLKTDPAEMGRIIQQEQQQREEAMAQPLKDPAQTQFLNSLREEAARTQQQAEAARQRADEVKAQLEQAVIRIGGGQ